MEHVSVPHCLLFVVERVHKSEWLGGSYLEHSPHLAVPELPKAPEDAIGGVTQGHPLSQSLILQCHTS